MHSELQRIQKDRAYFKFVFTGLLKPIKIESLSAKEQYHWVQIIKDRKALLDEFDNNSRELGLNVPEHKCFHSKCRCKVRYKVNVLGEAVFICNKHFSNFNEYLK